MPSERREGSLLIEKPQKESPRSEWGCRQQLTPAWMQRIGEAMWYLECQGKEVQI